MLHTMGWVGIALLGVFFAVSGAVMLVSPRMYFRWLSKVSFHRGFMAEKGYGRQWFAIELWTRIRGALLLAALAWVAYQGYLKIR